MDPGGLVMVPDHEEYYNFPENYQLTSLFSLINNSTEFTYSSRTS